MGSFADYQLSLAPPWLLGPYGEAWHLVLGFVKDAHAEGAREAVVCRFLPYAPLDALDEHGRDRQILRAPGEPIESFRARLLTAWQAWAKAGTGGGILLQLEPAGIVSATITEGASIDPSEASTWAKWYLTVHEPHPFTPPIVWGDGHLWGDGWLWGFADDTAIAYARAIIRKWQPAHVLCTGVLVEFSTPPTSVRLPVPWE